MVKRRGSLRERVFAYMEAHPRITISGVLNRFHKDNKKTVRNYFNEFYRYEKERTTLEGGIKILLNILVNKTQVIKKFTKDEIKALEELRDIVTN